MTKKGYNVKCIQIDNDTSAVSNTTTEIQNGVSKYKTEDNLLLGYGRVANKLNIKEGDNYNTHTIEYTLLFGYTLIDGGINPYGYGVGNITTKQYKTYYDYDSDTIYLYYVYFENINNG